jgi:hypothetical protein
MRRTSGVASILFAVFVSAAALGAPAPAEKLPDFSKEAMEALVLKRDFGEWKFQGPATYKSGIEREHIPGMKVGAITAFSYFGPGKKSVMCVIALNAEHEKMPAKHKHRFYQRSLAFYGSNKAAKLAGRPVVVAELGAGVMVKWWTDKGVVVTMTLAGKLGDIPEEIARAYMKRYPSAVPADLKVSPDWRTWHYDQVDYHIAFWDDPDVEVKAKHIWLVCVLTGYGIPFRRGFTEERYLQGRKSFLKHWREKPEHFPWPKPGQNENRDWFVEQAYYEKQEVELPEWAKKGKRDNGGPTRRGAGGD